jgi:hypothetical protein
MVLNEGKIEFMNELSNKMVSFLAKEKDLGLSKKIFYLFENN